MQIALQTFATALLVTTLANGAQAQAFVNDNDGLLDVGEAPGFPADPASRRSFNLRNRGIEDLDGTGLLTNVTTLDLSLKAIGS